MGRIAITRDLARTALRTEAARLAREGVPIREIARRIDVPVSTVSRWLQRADITVAGLPDDRTRLAEAALRGAWLCVERAMAAVSEASTYDAARAGRVCTDIYLDLTEGRRGAQVTIDARQQTAVTVYDQLTADELRRAIAEEESRMRLLRDGHAADG